MSNKNCIPNHIAIICDGNRRWAKNKGLPVFEGHRRAISSVIDSLVNHSVKRGVKYLTFWIFSTENWKRDEKEVEGLMNLFRVFFDKKIDGFINKGYRLNMIGDIKDFAPDIQEKIAKGIKKTKSCCKITVTLAMNYGGRDELTRAVQKIIDSGEDNIDQGLISRYLDTKDIPDPELIIRTSGEQRLSGFMLWQCSYSEFYFPDFHFPDFSPDKLDEALEVFGKRKRRFGK